MSHPDQDFLQYVVAELVDYPEDISISRKIDPTGVLLELKVNPDDMGRVIGRSGRTADAIRKLLWVLGTKQGNRISFKIIEPENSNFEGKKFNDTDAGQIDQVITDDNTVNAPEGQIPTSSDEELNI